MSGSYGIRKLLQKRAEWAWWLIAAAAVWITVGWIAALLALGFVGADRAFRPGERVLAHAALWLTLITVVLWIFGSSLPLMPAGPRLNDNQLAHQCGGLAIWAIFLAACSETVANRGTTHAHARS